MADAGGKNEGTPGRRIIDWNDFDRLHPKLVAQFRRLGTSLEDASELTQETFVQAHKSAQTFEGRSQFDTWMLSIAKKVWLKSLRHKLTQKRQAKEISLDSSPQLTEIPSVTTSVEDLLVSREFLSRVSCSIRELPEVMGKAVVMHYEGHKYREIAQHLGITDSRVASLIHQARKKLRRQYRP